MKKTLVRTLAVVVALMTFAAMADWDPMDYDGDGIIDNHKMHYPQLPDFDGWDVDVSNYWLADDFTCGGTGYIRDIHIWTSWMAGAVGWDHVLEISLEIYDAMPGTLVAPVWWKTLLPGDYVVRPVDNPEDQGWLDPGANVAVHPDHSDFDQLNVFIDEDEAYWQEKGNIYWLAVKVTMDGSENKSGIPYTLGWKNADARLQAVHGSEAIFYNPLLQEWMDIPDVQDLSMVITPEPSALGLFGLGGLLALVRRRRRV
jgi:hypothetical protein